MVPASAEGTGFSKIFHRFNSLKNICRDNQKITVRKIVLVRCGMTLLIMRMSFFI